MSSVTITQMKQPKDLNLLIAKNLRYFMSRPMSGTKEPKFRSVRALAIEAGIAPNTVENYLKASKRTVTVDKPEGYPVLDKLAKLAAVLDCDVWELLHPDVQKTHRAEEFYEAIGKDYQQISGKTPSEEKAGERLNEREQEARREEEDKS